MADYKKLTKAELVHKMENIEKLLAGSVEEAQKKSEGEAYMLRSAVVAGWLEAQ